ncbi:MAG: DUF86 domain-containing protein [Ignavibacteriales bacterium]|nr:MAG: DUF86 domain-containing protein [Ignavibacteriales bacterium]
MYLDDMLQSMRRISEYIAGMDFNSFMNDQKTIDAVVRNFEIIGEAAKNLPENLVAMYPEVPWKEMYYMRNKISHEYFGIDYEMIWDIAVNHLPTNKTQIEDIIETLE